jgi:hypothetical protein
MARHDAGLRHVTSKPGQPGRGGWQSRLMRLPQKTRTNKNNEKTTDQHYSPCLRGQSNRHWRANIFVYPLLYAAQTDMARGRAYGRARGWRKAQRRFRYPHRGDGLCGSTQKFKTMKTNQWELRQSRKSAAQIRADFVLASLAYRTPAIPGTLTRLMETIKKHLPRA